MQESTDQPPTPFLQGARPRAGSFGEVPLDDIESCSDTFQALSDTLDGNQYEKYQDMVEFKKLKKKIEKSIKTIRDHEARLKQDPQKDVKVKANLIILLRQANRLGVLTVI